MHKACGPSSCPSTAVHAGGCCVCRVIWVLNMALTTQSSKISSREWSSEADSNLAVTRTSLLHDKRYHWHDVKSSTNGFHKDHFVGESTYATVYEGILEDGTAIAVKRLKRARSRAKHDFEADVVSIARASHKNVAKLLGYSSTFFEKVFVFHYFSEGSLDAALHGDFVGPSPLDWDKRKAILFGVAEGLDYLHNLKPAMLHGRLTSRNVMLHQNCTPQLIDYHIGHPVLRNIPTQIPDIEWAMGYMAPELGVKVEMPCVQSDCYSFGFLLLEIVSGQRPWRLVTAANSAGLKQKDWVLASSAAVESLVDPQMTHLPSQSHPPLWEVQKLLELAVLCMADQPSKRPMMSDILRFLREELLMTRRPAELQDLFIELMVGESDGQHSVTMESEGSSRSDDLKQLGADELSWGNYRNAQSLMAPSKPAWNTAFR